MAEVRFTASISAINNEDTKVFENIVNHMTDDELLTPELPRKNEAEHSFSQTGEPVRNSDAQVAPGGADGPVSNEAAGVSLFTGANSSPISNEDTIVHAAPTMPAQQMQNPDAQILPGGPAQDVQGDVRFGAGGHLDRHARDEELALSSGHIMMVGQDVVQLVKAGDVTRHAGTNPDAVMIASGRAGPVNVGGVEQKETARGLPVGNAEHVGQIVGARGDLTRPASASYDAVLVKTGAQGPVNSGSTESQIGSKGIPVSTVEHIEQQIGVRTP